MSPVGPSSSRRRLLQVSAVSLGFGAVGGYLFGTDRFSTQKSACDRSDRHTDPYDWPAPRYDFAGTGRAPGRNAPRGDLTEQWHVEFHGDSIGQPVISGGRVAVAFSGATGSERIRTVDLSSGEGRWTERVTADGYMGNLGDLVASEGDLFYRTNTEDHGLAVVAISLGTGTRHWVAPADRGVYGRPAVTGEGGVWIPDRDVDTDESIVTSLSAETGVECLSWRVDGSRADDVYVRDGSLYVGTNTGIIALDGETGDELWRTEWSGQPQAVTEDRVFATDHPGFLRAYRTGSGAEDWTVESEHYMEGEPIPDNPGFRRTESGNSVARPNYRELAVAGGLLLARERVYSSHSDRITAFETDTGDEVWQLVPTDSNGDGTTVSYTGPVLAGAAAFACENRRGGESRLLRIDVSSGEILDSVEMATVANDSPSVGRGAVVVPREDGIACYADD